MKTVFDKKLKENLKIFGIVLLLFVSSRLLLTFVACVYNYFTEGYTKTWDLLCKFDAYWYVDIIDHGYRAEPNPITGYANYAFYPFYPIVVRFIKSFLPEQFTANQVGILVSNICTLIAGFVSVKLVRLKYPSEEGWFMAFMLFFAPHTIYFSMTYTEAMFVMFTVLFFYCCCRQHFLWASVFAFFAAFTRIAGVFLVFSLMIFMYEADYGKKFTFKNMVEFIKSIFMQPLRMLEILICSLGVFGYFYYLYKLVGDIWASAHVQVAWHNSYNGVLRTLYYNLIDAGSGTSSQYWALAAIFAFVKILYLCYKKYYAAAIFGLLAISLSLRTDAIAISRYIMGNFAIYIALYEFLHHRQTAKNVVMNMSIIITGIMYYMWFVGDCYFIF